MTARPPARARPSGPRRPRQIVALGGGGFTEEPDNPALDHYVLDATGIERPRICFLPTAGGDNNSYIVKFYAAFSGGHCVPTHVPLFNRKIDDVRAVLLSQDVIYVGGGNTVNLLAVWRAHGIDTVLREAWEKGVVLAGLCAGSMCWFEGGVTASYGTRIEPLHGGLGLLPGTNCPHYRQRRDAYLDAMRGGLSPGLAADDGVALHFVDRRLAAVVSSRADRSAYRVGLAGDRLIEAPLRPVVLAPGQGSSAARRASAAGEEVRPALAAAL
ncbi:MAG: Type 1 glutamine amidotransferase-like domain-containing protein [Thermoleophilia bacterium]